MQEPNSSAQVSRSTRYVMYSVMSFCIANYIARLFSFSFLRLYDSNPKTGHSSKPDQSYLEALAWGEFAFISGALQIIGGFLVLIVMAREIANFASGKLNYLKTASKFSAVSFLVYAAQLYLLFSVFPAGSEALSGTRAEGLDIELLMGIVAMTTSAILALSVVWVM